MRSPLLLPFLPIAATLLAVANDARAADDLSLSGMLQHGGESFDFDSGEAYLTLVGDLAALITSHPAGPAKTLGWRHVAVDIDVPTALVPLNDANPTPWQRAEPDEVARPLEALPQVSVRKGLPMSTEVGVRAGSFRGQNLFAFEGRIGVVEGDPKWPDLALHAGKSWFLGNDELDLSATTLGATVGYSWAFDTEHSGADPKIRDARISPWLDLRAVRATATPQLDAADLAALGAVPVRPRIGDDPTARPVNRTQVGAGLQVTSRYVDFRMFATATALGAPDRLFVVGVGMGTTL